MKRSQENWILMQGWEPASNAERSEVEQIAALDPVIRRRLEVIQALRDDLKSFRDEPECQYSTERLRDAIFSAGLKQERVSKGVLFGRLFAPMTMVAACAIAVFAWMNRPENFEPEKWLSFRSITEFSSSLKVLPAPSNPAILSEIKERLTAVSNRVAESTPAPISYKRVAEITRPQKIHRIRNRMGTAATVVVLNAIPPTKITQAMIQNPTPNLSPESGTGVGAYQQPNPVVVSAGTRDPHTGASVAIEAEKANDIVIGG